MSTQTQPRRPAGTPVGGQFDSTTGAGAAADLPVAVEQPCSGCGNGPGAGDFMLCAACDEQMREVFAEALADGGPDGNPAHRVPGGPDARRQDALRQALAAVGAPMPVREPVAADTHLDFGEPPF